MGRLAGGDIPEGCVPCTPAAVLELAKRSGMVMRALSVSLDYRKTGYM